jgi:hypothetical protein
MFVVYSILEKTLIEILLLVNKIWLLFRNVAADLSADLNFHTRQINQPLHLLRNI